MSTVLSDKQGNVFSPFLCSLCSRRRGMPSSGTAVGHLLDVGMEVERYLAKMLTYELGFF